ncbi:cathepsin L1-like [Hyposmocoma kahamanoa]|uniref:cathepsin L1-like n=1 Tax=Hyposmocoma kahamanoa TaxID=1477025 RepID=UPI000E6D8F1E|nr:cathepsin L1-like [Hyposmocoma kahamanoa]
MFALKPLLLLSIVASALAENSCSQASLQNQHPVQTNDLLFSLYLKAYGKEYCDDQEYKLRQNFFENNWKIISDLNKQHPHTKFGLNHMADWSDTERLKMNGFRGGLLLRKLFTLKRYVAQGNAPESLDWREKGLVTAIKDQGPCGSCYIFSAVGNIEGQYAKKYNKTISFSEQQVLDCDKIDGGCNGGNPYNVFKYLAQEGGLEEENNYPYKGFQGRCSTDLSKIVVNITEGQILEVADEEALKDALYNYGPLSIALNFESRMLSEYKGEIVDPNDCDPKDGVNHALVLVGYGTENNKPFWIIKNSWSATWGEAGYLRLIRGKNACSVSNYVFTSTIA